MKTYFSETVLNWPQLSIQCSSSKQPHVIELGLHKLTSPVSENINRHNLQCSPLRRPNGPQGIGFVALVSVYSSIKQTLPSKYMQFTILGARNKTEKVLALEVIISYWFGGGGGKGKIQIIYKKYLNTN